MHECSVQPCQGMFTRISACPAIASSKSGRQAAHDDKLLPLRPSPALQTPTQPQSLALQVTAGACYTDGGCLDSGEFCSQAEA